MESLLRPVIIHVLANSRSESHSAAGSYLRLRKSTITSAVTVYLDNDKVMPMYPGRWAKIKFTTIAVANPTATVIDVEFDVSDSDVGDDSLVVLNEIRTNVTANALETPAAIALNVGNAYTASVTPAAGTIRTVIVQNNGANEFWWGDANVDPATNRGTKILPNASAVIELSSTIHFKSATLNCTISLNYLKVL